MNRQWRAAFAMAPDLPDLFFGADMARLRRLVDLHPEVITDLTMTDESVLAGLDILITGWESPRVDVPALDRMPNLTAVLHSGGSVKGHLDPEVWQRGVVVSSAVVQNALPVAEYTLAMILLAAKRTLQAANVYQQEQRFVDVTRRYRDIGTNQVPIGLVGASTIGRRVLELLRPFDLRPLVYDPYVSETALHALGAQKVSLQEVMRCPVVSIHAPSTPETRRMVGAAELALMPDAATLINTARGSLVDHDALLAEVSSGRISAVLDVTEPEPLPHGHPFYSLPNVLVTPHVAGSHGNELLRMGRHVVNEVERLVSGAPLSHPVESDTLLTIA